MEDNIKLGTKAFDKMMFTLAEPVTEENHAKYGERPEIILLYQ